MALLARRTFLKLGAAGASALAGLAGAARAMAPQKLPDSGRVRVRMIVPPGTTFADLFKFQATLIDRPLFGFPPRTFLISQVSGSVWTFPVCREWDVTLFAKRPEDWDMTGRDASGRLKRFQVYRAERFDDCRFERVD